MIKIVLPLVALGGFLFVPTQASLPSAAGTKSVDAPDATAPVLVELFTSEGCSSCPPADALLSELERKQPIAGAEIIGLEEHVDYWNHDGWVDSYSSADWTMRQEEYATKFKGTSPYTPQMVVDGESQFVGSSTRDALEAIQEAARRPKAQVSIILGPPVKSDTEHFEVHVGNLAGTTEQEPADVMMAITEEGLETAVKTGENAGKNMQHATVLRLLHKIGTASAKDSSPFVTSQQVKLKSSWKKEHLYIVVFVQERKSLRVLGAASVRVTG